MERALELEVGTVPFMLRLGAQAVRLLATHRVVTAWELQQSRHLTNGEMTQFLLRFFKTFLTCSIPKFLSSAMGDRHVGQCGRRGEQSMQTR